MPETIKCEDCDFGHHVYPYDHEHQFEPVIYCWGKGECKKFEDSCEKGRLNGKSEYPEEPAVATENNMVMFSNGAEYLDFISESCENCKKYIDWQDGPERVCPTEQALATCNITGQGFPSDKVHLDEDGIWICEDFEGQK